MVTTPNAIAGGVWLLAVTAIALASPVTPLASPAAPCTQLIPHCKSCNKAADPVTCLRCLEGYFLDGTLSCSPCKVGTYSRVGVKCLACPRSQNTTGPGSAACTVCAAGFGVRPATGRCTACKAGTYSPGGTADACKRCHGDMTSSSDEASSCTPSDASTRTQALLTVYVQGSACPTDDAMRSVAGGVQQFLPPAFGQVRLLGCRPSGAGTRAAVQLQFDLSRTAASESAAFIAVLEEATQQADATAVFGAVPGLQQSLQASELQLSRACTANYLPSDDNTRCECQAGFVPDATAGGCTVAAGATVLVRITVPRANQSAPMCLRRCQGGVGGPTPTQCRPTIGGTYAFMPSQGVANVIAWPCSRDSLDEQWLLSSSDSLIRSAADMSLCLAVQNTVGAGGGGGGSSDAQRANVMVTACDDASPAQRWSQSAVDGSLWPQSPYGCLSICRLGQTAPSACQLQDPHVANVVSQGSCNPQQPQQYFELETISTEIPSRCKLEFSLKDPSQPGIFNLADVTLFSRSGAQIPVSELSASATSVNVQGSSPRIFVLSADRCIDGNASRSAPPDWATICSSACPPSWFDPQKCDGDYRLSITFPCAPGLSKVEVYNRVDCCQERLLKYALHFYGSTSGGADLYPRYDFDDAQLNYTIVPDEPR